MNNKEILLSNIDKIHTTKMGLDRIKRNLNLENYDVVNWCINKIKDDTCKITRKGKNYYIEIENYIITVNAYTYTIITSHKTK